MSGDEDVRRRLDASHAEALQYAAAYAAGSGERFLVAAVHEAGHAVVGALNGERIGDIVLCPPAPGETEWGGHTVREPGSADLSQQIQAALAGDAAEGSQYYVRDEQKAREVLGGHFVVDAEVQDHLQQGWQGVRGLVSDHREAIDRLAELIRTDFKVGEHRQLRGEAVRAGLRQLLQRDVEAPSTGDSEPCACGYFLTGD